MTETVRPVPQAPAGRVPKPSASQPEQPWAPEAPPSLALVTPPSAGRGPGQSGDFETPVGGPSLRRCARFLPLPRPGQRQPWVSWLLRVLSLAAVLLLWQLLTVHDVTLWVRFDKLPTVTDVAGRFSEQLRTGVYYADLLGSLRRILFGFGLAALAGVALGVLVARSRLAADLLRPPLEVFRPIPAIALVPIAILLFPTDEQGIVFITFAAAFFPVLVSTLHTVRALPTIWEDAVRTMGASRRQVLWRVILPGSLPGVFGGLSVGVGVAWICVISAEMISGEYGIGYRTWQAYTIVDYPSVIVGMLSIGLLGWLTAAGLELTGRRVTRWLPRSAGEAS